MNKIIEALNENLRLIYRKSVDADTALNSLQASGRGKFEAIFSDGSGFTTRNKRFGPYVEELAGEVAHLQDADQESINNALPSLVKKIELMLSTLAKFKKSI
jgi:hypothetical protein